MSDTSTIEPAILTWEVPPRKSSDPDPKVVEATIAAIIEKAGSQEEAVLAREVKTGWASTNKMALALKGTKGIKISSRKIPGSEPARFNIYARYEPKSDEMATEGATSTPPRARDKQAA